MFCVWVETLILHDSFKLYVIFFVSFTSNNRKRHILYRPSMDQCHLPNLETGGSKDWIAGESQNQNENFSSHGTLYLVLTLLVLTGGKNALPPKVFFYIFQTTSTITLKFLVINFLSFSVKKIKNLKILLFRNSPGQTHVVNGLE